MSGYVHIVGGPDNFNAYTIHLTFSQTMVMFLTQWQRMSPLFRVACGSDVYMAHIICTVHIGPLADAARRVCRNLQPQYELLPYRPVVVAGVKVLAELRNTKRPAV